MIKKLVSYLGEYKAASIKTPLFAALEAIMDVLLPTIMAFIIDLGIEKGDMHAIVKYGLLTFLVAAIALLLGVLAGKYAAEASTGFAGNLRDAMYENIQHYSFSNIDKFSTVACFGIAGATAVIVGKRIGEGAGREEVYSLGCCLLTVSFGVGFVVSVCLAVLLPTVFIPYLYPLFHLEGLALEIAVTMCVVYLFMLPLKAFDITNITGLLRAGGDSRMASIIDLSCQWVIAVPLTFLTALVFNAPVAVVCLCIQSENVCKCPWGILRLRSRKWINDVTGEDT